MEGSAVVGVERNVENSGIVLSTEAFGDAGNPAIVLLHGAGDSMLAWDEEFIERLVAGGRFVIRYDARDSGRSSTFEVGAPPHGLADVIADTVAVLDAYGLERATLYGMSGGSALAQLVALAHPERVAALVLSSGTPGGPGHEATDLPGMTPELAAFFGGEMPEPDWSDQAAVVDYLVASERPFAATSRPFDEAARRAQAARVVARASNIAAQLTNPFLMDAGPAWRDRLATVTAPTLVLHGDEDPLFPLAHGKALAAAIPGARFHILARTGHEMPPRDEWDAIVPQILALTP
ncbi:alpha/beta fold hydrolase [Nocardia sp. NPDC057668]|uniref:alpha/beta fold hydrolase n=1 Tax=Nocardia sp. NPDC057668 TaxID=3346202 RepID=UPI00366CF279